MYALVAVARPFPEPLTYAIPATLDGELHLGHVVLVPLGPVGETGYIVGFTDRIDFDPAKVRPITRLTDPEPAFNESQLDFFQWIASYYLAPLGMVIHTALPSRIKAKVVRGAEATETGILALTTGEARDEAAQVLREIIRRPHLTRRTLVRALDGELTKSQVERILRTLEQAAWLQWVEKEVGESKRRVATATLAVPLAEAQQQVRSTAHVQQSVLGALSETNTPIDVRTLVERFGSSASAAVKSLAERGLVTVDDRELRDPLQSAHALGPREAPPLNADQIAPMRT